MIHLRDITDFCARHRLTETRFGRDAVNDPRFVNNIRKGAQPRASTVRKVRDYMNMIDHAAKEAAKPVQGGKRTFILPEEDGGKATPPPPPAPKPKIPVAVLKAREIDGRDLPVFIEALVMMGLECWREDRLAHGEAVPASMRGIDLGTGSELAMRGIGKTEGCVA